MDIFLLRSLQFIRMGRLLIAGRYRIEATLGRGGGGAVFLVRETLQDDSPLALKRVNIPAGGSSPALADLKNEFATLSLLKHPHLAEVFDFEVTPQEMFFTSEWVEGTDILRWSAHADFNSIFALL